MSFICHVCILGENRILCIGAHFISSRLCITFATRLCTQLDCHHFHMLGKSSHGQGKCLILTSLGQASELAFSLKVTIAATSATLATTFGMCPALPDTTLLVRGQLSPLLGRIMDKGHLEVVYMVITGLELPGGTTDKSTTWSC